MLPAAQPLLLFHQAGGSVPPHGSGQAVPASAGHVPSAPERGGDRHRRQDARCGPDRDPEPVRTFKAIMRTWILAEVVGLKRPDIHAPADRRSTSTDTQTLNCRHSNIEL